MGGRLSKLRAWDTGPVGMGRSPGGGSEGVDQPDRQAGIVGRDGGGPPEERGPEEQVAPAECHATVCFFRLVPVAVPVQYLQYMHTAG